MQTFDLYKQYFNTENTVTNLPRKKDYTILGGNLFGKYNGQEVFLPVRLYKDTKTFLDLVCCTIRITSKKNIISTPLRERKGTVKELFNIDDYIITIKGMLIGKYGFPDEQILILRELYETTDKVFINCALTDLFMTGTDAIFINSLELPEVQGKGYRHRPFILECATDYVTYIEEIQPK